MARNDDERSLSILIGDAKVHLRQLDSSGAGGLSTAAVLDQVMKKVQAEEGLTEPPLVEDYFDIVAGAGTGAITMTLVGRLRMTTEQAVKSFARLSNEVFSDERLIGTPVFKASKLEKTLKDIVREATGTEDEPMQNQDENSRKCQVMVFTMSKHNMNSGMPTIIRSYPTSVNPGPNCTIWQALRAATAHPEMFKPMEIAEQGILGSFVDAAMGCGNPIEHVLAEAKRIYPNRRVATIVSIGAGHRSTIHIPEPSPLQRIFPTNVIVAMRDIATDNERIAQAMAVRFRGARDVYFRLNVDQGMQSVQLGDWDRLGEVQAHTRAYMSKVETNELVLRAVKATRERRGVIPVEHIGTFMALISPRQVVHGTKYQSDGELQIVAARRQLGVKTCPPPTSVYTERRILVQKAINCLTSHSEERRVFVFHGLGGAGKTQLALRTIERTRDHWSDVIYVDATSAETLTSTLRQFAIARSLGDTHEVTLLWLSSYTERWLIVFDNADDASLDLQAYFPKGAHGRVLVTTRARDIALLAQGPDSDSNVSSMELEESLQLLLAVARVNTATLTNEDRDTARAIVQDLGHLALAVVHAGAYIWRKSCTFGSYRQLYEERPQQILDGHTRMPANISGYERTIYATWKMSYDLLDERAKHTLWLLAYLQRDRITVEMFRRAATGMTNFEPTLPLSDNDWDALDETKLYLYSFLRSDGAWDLDLFLTTMAEIQSCSLISFDRANRTYELHPLVQEWIRTVIPHSPQMALAQSTFLLTLSSNNGQKVSDYVFLRSLELHVAAIMASNEHINQESAAEFGTILDEAGQYERAKLLWLQVVESRREMLGGNHSNTLIAMNKLANTYSKQGLLKQAEALLTQVLESGDRHPDILTVMNDLALTYSDQGLHKQAETLQTQVLEGRKRLLGDDHPDTLSAMSNLAITYSNQGLHKQAETLRVQVLEGRKRALGDEDPYTLGAIHNLALTYSDLGLYKQAETLEAQALEGTKRTFGDGHPDTLNAMSGLATAYWRQALYTQAETLQVDVLKGRRRVFGDEHPDTLGAMSSLANTYSDQGLYKQAETLQTQVLEGRKRAHGDEHSDTLSAMANLAVTYSSQGLYKQAEVLEVQVLEKRKRTLGHEHSDTLSAMNNLAVTYLTQGLHKQAETLQMQVLEGMKRVLGDDHPDTLTAMDNLAITYSEQGLHKQAETLMVQALEGRKRVLGDEHPATFTAMNNLAAIYSEQGLYKQVETLQVQGLEGMKRSLGDEHPDTLTLMSNLAITYSNQGLLKQAETLDVHVLNVRKRVFGDHHPETLDAMKGLAVTYKLLGLRRRREYKVLKAEIEQRDPSFKLPWYLGLFSF
ncbi:hypothetical protein FRC09_007045 [Ceratobasidium sp. 395]|nr:hypothetical protein FRC09_007045 [Ceratobasidium sp. 395]